MLVEFRVQNHRSLLKEQALSLEATRDGDERDSRPRQVPGHPQPLLPAVGLYGANASGKSNVLAALAFMREAVFESHRNWSPDDGVPRDQFAWGRHREEPSIFEATVVLNGVRFEYGFVASDECFLEEWLYAWPLGKKQVWFERDGNAFKFGDHLKGENKLIEDVTRTNALFLSAAAQHHHAQLMPLFSFFGAIQPINLSVGPHSYSRFLAPEYSLVRLLDGFYDPRQAKLFPDDDTAESLVSRFRELLKNADIGIVDMRLLRGDASDMPRRQRSVRFQLKHRSEVDDAWLPLEEESRGTRTLFRMALPILRAIDEGSVLLIDELEASLHPALAQQVVRQFNDPATNPRGAQLIFTTHDTNLIGTTLGEPVLRRDQVWLTEKDGFGATALYPLTDFRPRKAENLERGYLQGRYGAIPFLGDFALGGTD